MQQPTITAFYKTKKRPIQSPEEALKNSKLLASDNNRVQFVKKGNLSPVKKNPNSPVKKNAATASASPIKKIHQERIDLKRLKSVARNFKDCQAQLEKLKEQRKQLDQNKKQEEELRKERESTEPVPAVSEAAEKLSLKPSTQTLPLPFRLRVLKLLNDGMNSVASMFQNRNETITFNKLKPAVESMTKHTFTIKSVARMLTIDDYFKVVTHKIGGSSQYVFDFNVKLLPSQLVRLRKNFEAKLVQFCLIEHEEFLKSYNIEIERHLVTRWHPNFNLDGIQIPPAELPPLTEKLSSAAEVLSQVRELIQGPSSSKASSSPKSSPVKKAPIPPAKVKELKGISSALLQRIREREKNRIVRDLTTPKEELILQKMKGRLPEMVRIVHNIFVGEKKVAIELPLFLERLQYSYQKLTAGEIESHLDYLIKTQPNWIQKIKSTSSDYIKINKAVQINDLVFN